MKFWLTTGFIVIMWVGGFSQVLKEITLADTSFTYTDPDFELLRAAADGDTARIRAFLELGTEVNTSTWEGVTPLMFAAQNGHLDAVMLLIDKGAQVNRKPYNQIDALMGAVIAGHVHVADTLILNGADVNTRNLDGVTPLMYAAAFDHYLLCDVLIFYGAKVNTADNFGNYPVHYSVFYGNIEITALLLDHGAEINRPDLSGFTPLMLAAQNGHADLAAFLIASGGQVEQVNDYNCSALSLAIIHRQYSIADLLLQNGADATRTISGKTDHFLLADEVGGKEMASLLQEYGATPPSGLSVRKLMINYDLNWNNRDVMMGGSLVLLETKFGIEAEAGYRTRPWVRSVRFEQDPQTFYQYWEKRSLVYLGAGKRFVLASPKAGEYFGLFAGIYGGYTYGSLRGSNLKPEDKWVVIPKGGLFYNYKALNLRLNYEYMKIPNTNIPPHRVTFTIGAIFGLIKTNFKSKKEPRL